MKPSILTVAGGVLFVAGLTFGIHRPFLRHREGICTQYATMAQNHVRLGYVQTRLASYEGADIDPAMYEDWREYCYPNRPFLSVLVTSLWFQVFGDGEWVLRLSLIVVALGSCVAFAALARRLVDPRRQTLALALFAFNPMFWYFSIVVVHLAYALAFALAAWACWVRWEEGRKFRVWTILFLALACESDWPGYYATASVALDAFLRKRRAFSLGIFSIGLGTFALHVLHLWWVDPAHGPLVRKLFQAGADRSLESLPRPLAFLSGEFRELGLYFTVGMLVLALAGLRSLPSRIWALALLGLDEVLFTRWAHEHDFLTYPLVPFVVLAAVQGVGVLATLPRGLLAVRVLLALAAVQSAWVAGDRFTRTGAFEVYQRAGLAIREGTKPEDRVLLTFPDVRQFTPYYARRYTAAVEQVEPFLMVHPSGRRVPISELADLERSFPEFSVVLVGDPALAAAEIGFFKGKAPSPAFRFLDADHPLRRKLEQLALSKEIRGAFVLYRLRAPYSPR